MTGTNVNSYEQVYNVREDDTLLSKVAFVLCVMVPRGLYIAGFSITKELLTINYTGYSKNKPVWELDFFEQLFSSEPLLAVKDKVKGAFICSHKNMVVPQELYEADKAVEWLQRIHYIEQKEIMATFELENEKAAYLHTLQLNISELVKINFKRATVLPLSSYQFGQRQAQILHLQCCITGEEVVATLHNYSQLLWHKVFNYECGDDIAYAIKLLCKENYIDAAKLNITCNAL